VVGVEPAILFYNIVWWIEKNQANEKHFHDGDYWTYNSCEAFAKLFPFWNRHKIRRLLETLREYGLIKTGEFNQSSFDKSLWYAIDKAGYRYAQNCHIDVANLPHGYSQNESTIPDINTDSKPDIKTYNNQKQKAKNDFSDDFEKFYSAYPRKINKSAAYKRFNALTRKDYTPSELISAASEYAKECVEKNKEEQYILHPTSFLGSNMRFVDYIREKDTFIPDELISRQIELVDQVDTRTEEEIAIVNKNMDFARSEMSKLLNERKNR
jgi:hypothetical protein